MPEQTDTTSTTSSTTGESGNSKERVTLVLTVAEYKEISKALQQMALAGVKLFTQQHPNYTVLKGLFSSMLEQEARREVETLKAAIQQTEAGAASDRRIRVDGGESNPRFITSSPAQEPVSQEQATPAGQAPEVELVPRDTQQANSQQPNAQQMAPNHGAQRKKTSQTANQGARNRQSKKATKKGRRRR